MENIQLIQSFIILILPILLGTIIYLVGGRRHGGEGVEEESIAYACGEDPPSIEESKVNLERYFIFAVYFLIFDVFAFIIAISSSIEWHLPTIYSLIVLATVMTLLTVRRRT